MSDDLREVLAEHMEIPPSWMRGNMQVHIDQMFAALRQVEQRAFERAAQVAEGVAEAEEHAGEGGGREWAAAKHIATAIRALSTPSLIRESTKGEPE